MTHPTSCTFVTGSACESRVGSVRVRSRCRVQKWGRGRRGRGKSHWEGERPVGWTRQCKCG
ncbi:hypothetical protein HOY82DRAFT_557029 [Tuber indicum]|nr:hypothetical protein HOY82DRAFT_557029 [Tuber indicum]